MRSLPALAAATCLLAAAPSPALADGSIVLLPSIGRPTQVTVTGRALKSNPERDASALRENLRRLTAKSWEHVAIEVHFQGATHVVTSDDDGMFEVSFPAPREQPFALGALPIQASAGSVSGEGTVLVVADDAPFLVISDFDDTAAVSNVQSKKTMLKTALMDDDSTQPAVEGMADFYSCLARGSPSPGFAFVTGSPVEYGARLQAFLSRHRFPAAALLLRHLSPKTLSGFKEPVLRSLLSRFPQKVVLIGDSGEKDPEVYAALRAEFPKRVAAIFIRDVGKSAQASRFDGMTLFKTAAQAARAAASAGLADPECVAKAFPDGS